jgi:eukaryotic-like serine/threonine-protein kinase
MKDILTYLKSRLFFKNLGLALELIFILVAVLIIFLRIYTRHGRFITVPDFADVTLLDAKKIVDENHLRFEVLDSIFLPEKAKGAIIDQHPKPGQHVKKNRIIYFTVNASSPGKMVMPDLVGLTVREARVKIVSSGLKVGNFSYRFDMAKNVVLEQKVQGSPNTINPGDTILKGTQINLVLGKGLSEDKTSVPDLLGLTLDQAKTKASDAFFSVGAIINDKEFEESEVLNARIYKQRPIHASNVRVPLGTPIDLWLTVDSVKLAGSGVYDSLNYVSPQQNDNYNEDIEDDSYSNDYN